MLINGNECSLKISWKSFYAFKDMIGVYMSNLVEQDNDTRVAKILAKKTKDPEAQFYKLYEIAVPQIVNGDWSFLLGLILRDKDGSKFTQDEIDDISEEDFTEIKKKFLESFGQSDALKTVIEVYAKNIAAYQSN